jgi:ATP-dependent Clp protease ATP-binding subunit ClpC
MSNFDINSARNFNKARKEKALISGLSPYVKNLMILIMVFGGIGVLYSLAYVASYLENVSHLAIAASGTYLIIYYFLKSYNKPISYINSENVVEALDQKSLQVLDEAIKLAQENKFARIEPVLLMAAIEKDIDGKYMLLRAGFGLEKDISGVISDNILKIPRNEVGTAADFAAEFLGVLESARENAASKGRTEVKIGDLFMGLIRKSDIFKTIMFDLKMEEKDIESVVEWHDLLTGYQEKLAMPFYEKPMTGGIGKDWSFGYTRMLNSYAKNINTEIEFMGETHVYGRSKEVDEIERVLSKTGSNNVLLIGEPGIGKKTIVKGFVSRIISGSILPVLKYSQVFQVDTGAILSGSGDEGEIAMRVKSLLNEAARAGDVILFFDSFHSLVSRTEGVGQANTSEIIIPYLQGAVRVIGATTIKEYHRDIEANPAVSAAFEKIEVKEPNTEETIEILEEMVPFIEHRDGVFWPYQSLREVVRVAAKYIQNVPFPTKAIEIIDDASVSTAKAGQKIVLTAQIDELVSSKLEVPVAEAQGQEAQKLLNLEEFLHQRVIGQNEAIQAVASAMRRARAGIESGKRPIGTFLFLGPTGVGKTETAKALAEAYFGSEKSMIRVDMSEYQEQSSIYKLIGSPPAAGSEGEKGQLTTAVADTPFTLILLDELEKAHPDILTLFLQVFDDGRLTDGTGKVIDFTNSIIIATSNAGSEQIRQNIMHGVTGELMKKTLLEFLQTKGIFRPEFLNRFDAIVAFKPLTQDEIVKVATLMLKALSTQMAEKEITLKFTEAAIARLAKTGFDPVFGARPMRRVIQDKVENILANSMLSGQIARGSTVVLDEKDIV